MPLPAGYYDATAELGIDRVDLVLAASTPSEGYRPTITVQKVPVAGGSFADATECAKTGRGLVQGGSEASGVDGQLKSAAIVEGPLGQTCQIHLAAPQGVALITELHEPGNGPLSPKPIWVMTCNHAEGDHAAEAVCRSVLSGFKFRNR